MKIKIELVMTFLVYTGFGGEQRLCVAVYRRRKNRLWVYNILANGDHELPNKEFDGLEAYRFVQKDKEWIPDWEDVIEKLSQYSWEASYPMFCRPEYAETLFEAYLWRQDCLRRIWGLGLGLVPDDSVS